MSCLDEITVNELVDGELETERRASVERHLAECARCRDEVAATRALLRRVAALPRELAPPRELWSAISGRTVGRTSRAGVRPRAWLAAAAAVALLAAAWFALGRPGTDGAAGSSVASSGAAAPDAALPAAGGVAGDDLAQLTEAYVDATRRLLGALEARGGALQREDRAELDRSLALIDRAIDEVRLAVARRPEDPDGQRALRALYRQKMDVLWRVSRMTS